MRKVHDEVGGIMAYRPGDTVPRDGTVRCTQHPSVTDEVKEGKTFPPADHWGQHNGPGCTWEYVD
jgi:hypothetical protein